MRFFVMCPANIATGGTELLHQFCSLLTKKGIENYIVYIGGDGIFPTPERFFKYNVKYVSEYVDAEDSILVLPETQVQLVDTCKKGIVMIWWLSVDHYFMSYNIEKERTDIFGLCTRKNVIHYVQSYYAEKFLKHEWKIKECYYLQDYINDDIVELAKNNQEAYERKNYVLYNPKKGYNRIKPLIEASASRTDIKWIPLINYSPQEITLLMLNAKVYIDFGYHPGKDRIPREAAISGCCVITNRMGSAQYREDVNIPDEYRIENQEDTATVLDKIYDLIDNYDSRRSLYDDYRNIIVHEKQKFENDLHEMIERMEILTKNRQTSSEMFDMEQYESIIDTMYQTSLQIERNFADLGRENSGNRKDTINALLEIDSIINLMKEAVYSFINEIV
ncbi:UDP-galactopyranose mutase [Waltera intestinalis]|uniref:UDP-galactopyranose mutase n=1 Tax=Waltera intestinalis TaxID=2606635 RepID=A0A6L5YKM8_9FIRM|nr:UDP-galactopyranose mutase [Waltera intestinalis]MST58845.1 UDP-galactopyranose mutase [Waltera intestinalis]